MKRLLYLTVTFLLLFSLAGCSGQQKSETDMTVFGAPNGNGVEHSWNMVNLNGEWYCVDCAWDDPIGGSPCHTYFNVTSDDLRSGSIHRWDESSVPEATGTTYAYDGY